MIFGQQTKRFAEINVAFVEYFGVGDKLGGFRLLDAMTHEWL